MGASRSIPSVADTEAGLRQAAEWAMLAPSILNTQPWRWRVHALRLDLFADFDRVVASVDRDRRMLTISCGAALHHACATLRSNGMTPQVTRYPDPNRPDLLATIAIVDERPPDRHELDLAGAIWTRRSDRRPIQAPTPPGPSDVDLMRRAAEQMGARLHLITEDQQPFLALAASSAASIEDRAESYQRDLVAWTDERRPGEGVSIQTLVAHRVRPVPLRDFAGGGETRLHPGHGDDANADYLILATDGDTPVDGLRAGEALSLVWLTATNRGLAGSVLSNVIEVPGARALVASLLPEPGQPQLVLRLGIAAHPAPPPASPRRRPESVITVEGR
jgi:nitroreductase